MSIYTTQSLTAPPFSQWALNGCAVSAGSLIIDPGFVPASPIAQATGYRGIGGYGAGYASYTDRSLLSTSIEVSADSPDVALTPVSMAAIGQIIATQSIPGGCAVKLLCSYDRGVTWHVSRNGSWWPGMIRNGAFAFTQVRFRVVMTTPTQGLSPAVSSVFGYITGRTLSAPAFPLPSSTVPCMTATQPDFVARLKDALPARWFGDDNPVLDGVLNGSAAAWLNALQQICALHDQTRLQTASAPFLDIAAYDFYGPAFPRNAGESDAAFRLRLRSRLFQPVVTRDAVRQAAEQVTDTEVEILEIGRAADCGGYGISAGYTAGGHYGSLTPPAYQAFVTAYRPKTPFTGGGGGYGAGFLGYSDSGAYADINTAETAADAAIYAAIESVRPAATALWVRILNAPMQYGPVVPL